MGQTIILVNMKTLFLFTFAISLTILTIEAKPRGKIIGGEEAPKHEFPWQISLRNLGSHICGGSIINRNQVITAAHCVEGASPAFDSVSYG